jgi:hypothetical protein
VSRRAVGLVHGRAERAPALADVAAQLALRDLGTVLVEKALEDAPRAVALLCRRDRSSTSQPSMISR